LPLKNQKQKITLIGPTYPYRGGVSQHTTLLCHYLRHRFDVDFISFKRQYPALLFPGKSDKDPSLDADQEKCDYLLDSINPLTWVRTAQHIHSNRPDLLVIIWWVPFFAVMWWLLIRLVKSHLDIPVLFVCHNVFPHEKSVFWSMLTRWILQLPDGFTVHSKTDDADLQSIRSQAKIFRLPIAPHPRPKTKTWDQKSARSKLGLDEDTPVFLFFGFVRPYKGLDILLNAFAALRQTKDATLLVAGEFWGSREPYDQQIQKLQISDSVHIVDRYIAMEEMGLYFGAVDAVVLPYRSATQSGIPQLAFALDRPIVVTDVGGLAENIKHPSQGIVVPPNDTKALTAAMSQFFGDRRKQALKKSSSQKHFDTDWIAMVDTIEEFIKSQNDTNKS